MSKGVYLYLRHYKLYLQSRPQGTVVNIVLATCFSTVIGYGKVRDVSFFGFAKEWDGSI